jgi:hypothetical protein
MNIHLIKFLRFMYQYLFLRLYYKILIRMIENEFIAKLSSIHSVCTNKLLQIFSDSHL